MSTHLASSIPNSCHYDIRRLHTAYRINKYPTNNCNTLTYSPTELIAIIPQTATHFLADRSLHKQSSHKQIQHAPPQSSCRKHTIIPHTATRSPIPCYKQSSHKQLQHALSQSSFHKDSSHKLRRTSWMEESGHYHVPAELLSSRNEHAV
jgi:hypothetical protein